MVLLAVRHNWTPEQVVRMEPDFLMELLARERAEATLERRKHRRMEQAIRRGHSSSEAEDVDVTEIPDGRQGRTSTDPQPR